MVNKLPSKVFAWKVYMVEFTVTAMNAFQSTCIFSRWYFMGEKAFKFYDYPQQLRSVARIFELIFDNFTQHRLTKAP